MTDYVEIKTVTDRIREAMPLGKKMTSNELMTLVRVDHSSVSGTLGHLINMGEVVRFNDVKPYLYQRVAERKFKRVGRKTAGEIEHSMGCADPDNMKQEAIARAKRFLMGEGYQVIAP